MKERDLIESLARKAGDSLMKHFRQDWDLLKERRPAKEALTIYDKEVDRLIIAEIKRLYPRHSLLTEESGFLQGDPDWLWQPFLCRVPGADAPGPALPGRYLCPGHR